MCYSISENQTPPKDGGVQTFSQETWNRYPFAGEEKLKWFRDAGFGLFFHVGLSALGQVDIGWSRHTHKLPDPGVGDIPDEVYDGWATQIELKSFNAREWIKLAIDGGMKYVVIITKHHDGFHMWDTKTSEYKITNSPFKRDYIRELVDACHEVNMKIGLYFSERDWVHPDYEPVDPSKAKAINKPPYFEMNEGEIFQVSDRHKKYIKYMHDAIIELMTNYGKIDILWWDAWWCDGMFKQEMWQSDSLEREVRTLQPHILINNRANTPGDFDTPEGHIGMFQNHRAWETCMTLCPAWAWTGEAPKSFKTVISHLVKCICGDGNYLLSIGSMPNGEFDAPEKERIHQIGLWLKAYGESIYTTRGGPWLPDAWGGSCHRDNIIYLHILNCKGKDSLNFHKVSSKINTVECLTGETISFESDENGITFNIDKNKLANADIIVKITLEKAL